MKWMHIFIYTMCLCIMLVFAKLDTEARILSCILGMTRGAILTDGMGMSREAAEEECRRILP